MNADHLKEAHFYLLEAFDDLQRAKKHLSLSGVDSFVWFERNINRTQTTIRGLLEGIVNRLRPLDK